jgi:hypothetical protein
MCERPSTSHTHNGEDRHGQWRWAAGRREDLVVWRGLQQATDMPRAAVQNPERARIAGGWNQKRHAKAGGKGSCVIAAATVAASAAAAAAAA